MATERSLDFSALVRGPSLRWQNPRKLSHFIARDLRGLILRGVLAPDQALPSEGDLLQAFNVSRSTLREALRILESESLIAIKRGRSGGAVVQRPQTHFAARYVSLLLQVRGATVADIQEARLMIEPHGAVRLFENATTQTLETLSALHDQEVALVDDPPRFLHALGRFDRTVLELGGNKTISVVSNILREIIGTQRFVEPGFRSDVVLSKQLANLHGVFIRDVAASDAIGAEDTWREYVSETAKLLGRVSTSAMFDVVPVWRLDDSDRNGTSPSNTMAAAIATEFRIRIARGDLRQGDQLPAMPELAEEFGASRPTMRESLRVLEMEGLVDLRTGSRSGATVSEPTADAAADLAIILLASVQTRMADAAEASRLIAPSVIQLVAARIDDQALAEITVGVRALEGLVDNTVAFMESYEAVSSLVFTAASNPAASVAWEMLRSVAVACRRGITISALSQPKVIRGNRLAYAALKTFIAAAQRHDVDAARVAFTRFHEAIAPFFDSALGDRLIVDLFD